MTPQERGFILLSSRLGCVDRPVLTPTMMKKVYAQVTRARQDNAHRYLTTEELLRMGLQPALAQRVIGLMGDHMILEQYLRQAERAGCVPLTPFTVGYPQRLWAKLGYEGPCCLWAKGDLSLLNRPAVAVVGSRDPRPRAAAFAMTAGRIIAEQGYVLVSGNARGVDRLAQDACLAAGGAVVSVVADCLSDKMPHDRIVYLSENDFDTDFTAGRALSRNRVIHAMAELTVVSQCTEGRGGTWSGSRADLKNKWSPLVCLSDGTPGAYALEQLGAKLVTEEQLERFIIEN